MTNSIDSRFQRGPNPGGSGNPGGAHNAPAMPNINPGYYGQQSNQGRYRPPMMNDNGVGWADHGGYSYNVPNHYGVGSGWQSPQMSPFPQFNQPSSMARNGGRSGRAGPLPNSPEAYAQYQQALERARRGIADGSVTTTTGPGTNGRGTTTSYQYQQDPNTAPTRFRPRPADGSPYPDDPRYPQQGTEDMVMWAGGSPDWARQQDEAMAEFQRRYGHSGEFSDLGRISLGLFPNAYNDGLAGRAPYMGPRETHVGGPSDPERGAKPPPAPIDGGTKGPMPVIQPRERLDDWEWQAPRGRFGRRRWGRY